MNFFFNIGRYTLPIKIVKLIRNSTEFPYIISLWKLLVYKSRAKMYNYSLKFLPKISVYKMYILIINQISIYCDTIYLRGDRCNML